MLIEFLNIYFFYIITLKEIQSEIPFFLLINYKPLESFFSPSAKVKLLQNGTFSLLMVLYICFSKLVYIYIHICYGQ